MQLAMKMRKKRRDVSDSSTHEKNHFDVSTIAKITGLSKQEIEYL